MRNSVKFFLGGVVAATLIFVAFAFTAKQTENKEYLVIRLVETNEKNVEPIVQICDKEGNTKVLYDVLTTGSLGLDVRGNNTEYISELLNKYSAQGYNLSSTSVTSFNHNVNEFASTTYLITTFILEK